MPLNGGHNFLFTYEAGDDVQEDGEQNRHQNRTRNWKIERAILALDTNVTGQAPEGDTEFGGKVNPPADEE